MKERALKLLDAVANAGVWAWDQRWRVIGLILCGAAPGYAQWMHRHRADLDQLKVNRLDEGVAEQIIQAALVSLAVALVAVVIVHVSGLGSSGGSKTEDGEGDAPKRRLGASIDLALEHGVLALCLPMIAALEAPKLETESPWFSLALAAACAGIVGVWAYRRTPRPRPGADAATWTLIHTRLPALLTLAAAAWYAQTFSQLSLIHHYNLTTSTHDLGIYDNLFWHASHGNGLRSTLVKGDTHLAAHFDPILILLSPIYMLAPRAQTLIVLQSVWIAAGVIPLYLLAQRKLDSDPRSHWAGLALSLCYLMHPGIQGANIYDFHSLTLAIPLLFGAVLMLELDKRWAYAAALAALLLVREDMSLLAMSLGLYALITERKRAGVLTIVGALAYLLVVKLIVMPDAGLLMKSSKTTYGYSTYFEYLIPGKKGGVKVLLTSLLSNPMFVLRSLVIEDKALYLARCFGPLLVLPFFAKPGRVLLVYGLGFCLLGTKPALYSLHFQYVTLHTPFAFALVPLVLANPGQSPALARFEAARARFARGALAACVVMSTLVSWKYGAVVENDSFLAGYYELERTYDEEAAARYEWLQQAIAKIPPEASVAATDHLVPHVSNRAIVEKFPDDDARGLDYLLIDRAPRRRSGPSVVNVAYLEDPGAYREIDAHPTGLALLVRMPEVPLPPKPKKPKKPRNRNPRSRR